MTEPRSHPRSIGRTLVTLLAVWAVLPATVAFVSGTVDTTGLRASESRIEIHHGDREAPSAPLSDFGFELEEESEEEDERSRRRVDAAVAGTFTVLVTSSPDEPRPLAVAAREPLSRRRGAPSGRDPPRA